MWSPAFFGVKPALVIKGGVIATAPMGDPNASIPTPPPVHYRPMFGALGGALQATRMTFLSAAARADGLPARLGLASLIGEVRQCRTVRKQDMINNHWQHIIEVDAQTYQVRANGQLLT